MLDSIISYTADGAMTVASLIICTLASLALGVGTALLTAYKNKCSKTMLTALIFLPALVQLVIMLVNGNVGTGIAVAGAFSLVRFRSAPGSAREITAIFLAMVMGLASGSGYLGYAVIFFVIIGAAMLVLPLIYKSGDDALDRELRITVPENLNYTDVFNDIFADCTSTYRLERVKTTNMGSMFELRYTIKLKHDGSEKELIDKIRCRNGNLTVLVARITAENAEL